MKKRSRKAAARRSAKFLGSNMNPTIQFAVAFIFVAALILVAYVARNY